MEYRARTTIDRGSMRTRADGYRYMMKQAEQNSVYLAVRDSVGLETLLLLFLFFFLVTGGGCECLHLRSFWSLAGMLNEWNQNVPPVLCLSLIRYPGLGLKVK